MCCLFLMLIKCMEILGTEKLVSKKQEWDGVYEAELLL